MNSPTEPEGPVTWRDLLLNNLVDKFSLEEIEDVCFRLGIDADNLSGDTRAKKARQLILFVERHSRLAELVALGKRLRPDLTWELPVGAGLGKQEGIWSEERPTGRGELPQADVTQGSPAPVPGTREGLSTSPPMPDILVIDAPFRLELVRVPAGEFWMGSDPTLDRYAWPGEVPKHRVYVSEFYIGKYAVTNVQYATYARVNGIAFEFEIVAGKRNHPVVEVLWDEAVAFCKWVGQVAGRNVRLPTEAEWEKAARSADGRIYPWGNSWEASRLNSEEAGVGETTPVDKYSPSGDSPYGAADMAGNVWEWTADWYNENEYSEHIKSGSPVKDPTGPAEGDSRVLRGGSWAYKHGVTRATYRRGVSPRYPGLDVGFRVVLGWEMG
jgi:sulfatase modifying factor 1